MLKKEQVREAKGGAGGKYMQASYDIINDKGTARAYLLHLCCIPQCKRAELNDGDEKSSQAYRSK